MLTVISGAAPGVEQGAIEAAVNLALHWSGRAMVDHIASLPQIYRSGLLPTISRDPGMVRRLNCQDADGALVFSTSMVLVGVPAFVDRVTEQMGRAFLHVTLSPFFLHPATDEPREQLPAEVIERIRAWLRDLPGRVYITGPSEDDVPGIQAAVRDALIAILEPFAVDEVRETTRMMALVEQNVGLVLPTPESFSPPPSVWDAVDCRGEPLDLSQLDAVPDPIDSDAPTRVHQAVSAGPVAEFLLSLECCPRPPSKDDIDRLTDEFYKLEGNGAGGSLHVVLDDCNWERECVEFCRKWAADRHDVAGERFADLLLTLTDEQLRKYLGAGYCGRCGADYGDEHVRSETVQQTFPPGRCPECGSEPTQSPTPGDQTA